MVCKDQAEKGVRIDGRALISQRDGLALDQTWFLRAGAGSLHGSDSILGVPT